MADPIVNAGWLLRYIHANGASFFFICCAPCEPLCVLVFSLILYLLGSYLLDIWVPIYFDILKPNKIKIVIAEVGNIIVKLYRNLIYHINKKMGNGQAEDNKLDTFDLPQKKSSDVYLMFGNKVNSNKHSRINRSQVDRNQSILISRAQAAKSIETFPFNKGGSPHSFTGCETRRYLSSKSTKLEPRDLTASLGYNIPKSEDGVSHSNINNNMKDHRVNVLIIKNENKQTLKGFLESQIVRNDENNKYRKLNKILGDITFLELCYRKTKSKLSNLSKSINNETLDDINKNYFKNLSDLILKGKFKFSPVRRVLIPKPNKPDETKPLGIGTPKEKILQTGIVELLNYIYEPIFLDVNHGFRPKRSVKTALDSLHKSGEPYVWVIQGDISKFFDNISHNLILDLLKKRIDDVHFLKLIENFLKAGYKNTDNGKIVKSNIGIPQGSPVSPILSNIVLHEFDSYVMNELKYEFEGITKRRSYSPEFDKLTKIILGRIKASDEEIREVRKQRAKLPYKNPMDPKFKRLLYVRYADDFVILIIGSKNDAINIRSKIKNILEDRCKAKLNIDKTLISNIRDGFDFLGVHIKKLNNRVYKVETKSRYGNKYTRYVPLKLFITAPILKIINKLIENRFAKRNHFGIVLATGRKDMILKDHYSIINYYNYMIQGLLNFFSFAENYSSLHRVFWILRQSCALTLANKFKLRTMKKAFNKFGFDLKDPDTGIKLNIPSSLNVKHQYGIKSNDSSHKTWEGILSTVWSGSLTSNIFNKVCTICGTTTNIEMHHICKIADVRHKIRTGNATLNMIDSPYKRKQVPLCKYHHNLLHKGDLNHSDISKISRYIGTNKISYSKNDNK